MATVEVPCVYCSRTEAVVKNGKAPSKLQRFFCKLCKRSFQTDFIYRGNYPDIPQQVVSMAMNCSGIRDTGRVLGVSPTTVISHLRNLSPKQVTDLPFENAKVQLLCEMDEQWSFVGGKKNQRWLFYAWEPRFKRVIAHAFGRRTTETLKTLLELLSPYTFSFYCTDDWKPYTTNLPEKKHVIGKFFTQRIERNNLTLRTRLKRLVRRTICFSRSEELHDKVIGEFISRKFYQRV